MGSVFAGIWSEAVGILDGVYGEQFMVTPMAGSTNARPALDPNRVGAIITAEFLDDAFDDFGMSPGHTNNTGQKIVSSHSRIVITLAGLPYPLVKDDRLTRVSTGEKFEIETLKPDGFGRATITLTTRRPAS